MGSTADSAVPSGHWPDGTGRASALERAARKNVERFPCSERRVAARHRPVACATRRR